MLIIGLDPGLGCTGWGVIAAEGNRLSHVANGQVRTDPKQALPARLVKKAVVGTGGADKAQIHFMVQRLLPGVKIAGADAADALAVAITHAHHLASARRVA